MTDDNEIVRKARWRAQNRAPESDDADGIAGFVVLVFVLAVVTFIVWLMWSFAALLLSMPVGYALLIVAVFALGFILGKGSQ